MLAIEVPKGARGFHKTVMIASNRHFDRLASQWEQKFAPHGSMSQRPAAFVRMLRENVGRSKPVLDFGCGTGDITIACQEAGFKMLGIDASPQMIERARRRSVPHEIEFALLDSAPPVALRYPAESFDAVIASSVLEYVSDPLECLNELSRVCIRGGCLVLTVPNLLHPRRWLEALLRRVLFPHHFKNGSRWHLYAEYLRMSKNRLTLRYWRRLLAETDWQLESVNAKNTSLLMLVAKRISLPLESVTHTEVPLLSRVTPDS
jgi:ubiquinone/menaquinone biosynthesis C-methylase UbiE